jgi:hypothetical protein
LAEKSLQHDTTRQPQGCAPHGSTTNQNDTTPQRNRRRRTDRSHCSNYHTDPEAASHLAEDELASTEPPKHSTNPSDQWTSKARPQEAKRHKSAALARSREGSRVSPGEPGRRSRDTRFDDAFKKEAAPTGVTVVGPGRPPRQSFRPAKSPKKTRARPKEDRHRPPPATAGSLTPEQRSCSQRSIAEEHDGFTPMTPETMSRHASIRWLD